MSFRPSRRTCQNGCLNNRKGSASMNDNKRDYIIMTIATVVILILLILFYTALSNWAQ